MAFADERCTSSGIHSSRRVVIIGFTISTQISGLPCQRDPGAVGQIKALAVIATFWRDGLGPPKVMAFFFLFLFYTSCVSNICFLFPCVFHTFAYLLYFVVHTLVIFSIVFLLQVIVDGYNETRTPQKTKSNLSFLKGTLLSLCFIGRSILKSVWFLCTTSLISCNALYCVWYECGHSLISPSQSFFYFF